MIPMRINDNGIPRFTTGTTIVLLVSFLVAVLVGGTSGEYESSGTENFAIRSLDGSANGLCSGANCAERGSGVSGAMWFGPRLGRRRRSDEKTESYYDDRINAIVDSLQDVPWTVVKDAGHKRPFAIFIPRKGRETSEESLQKLLLSEGARLTRLIDHDDILDERQSPPPPPPPQFAPRLGPLPFTLPSERLGRRLGAHFQKL